MDSLLRTKIIQLASIFVDKTTINVTDSNVSSLLSEITSIINSDNNIKAKLYIDKNGVASEVKLDTTSPYNNVPIPVTITGIDGSTVVNLTTGDLDVNIQHDGASPSSVRIGDGTSELFINPDGSINIRNEVPNLSQYKFLDEATDSVSTDITYYGFMDPEGRWYIIKEDTSSKSMRYINGTDAISPYVGVGNAWENRESHGYTYINNLIWI